MRHLNLSRVRHLIGAGALAIAGSSLALGQDNDPRGMRCVTGAIERLDDRTSDARSVAAAAIAVCRDVRFRAMKAMQPQATEETVNRALTTLREEDIDGATAMVLEARRRSR